MKKILFWVTAFVAFFVVILPKHSSANMPPLLGATVAGGGSSTSPGGILATTADLTIATGYTVTCIDTAIMESTREVIQAIAGQTEAMKVIARGQLEAQMELMKQLSLAELKTDLERNAGAEAQAENSCQARDGAAAYGVGRTAEGGMRQELRLKNAEMADGKLDTGIEVVLANFAKLDLMEGEDPTGTWLFPPNGLIPDQDLKKANELARQSINPHPTPKFRAGMESTPAGKEAIYNQHVKSSRLAVAEDTLNAIIAAHSPLVDAGAVLEALQASMGQDQLEVPQNDAGRTSIMSYLDVWSKSRFGSPNWHQQLFQATSSIKLSREIAYMQAMQVELNRRNLEFQMRNSQMLAAILGILVENSHNNAVQTSVDPARAPLDGRAGKNSRGDHAY